MKRGALTGQGGRAFLVLVVGAALLGGCAGSDSDGAASRSEPVATVPASDSAPAAGPSVDIDACATVAKLDLEKLLGGVGDLVDESNDLNAACHVEATDPDSQASLSLSVETKGASVTYETEKKGLPADREVSGLGDDAFHFGDYLFVLQGDALVRLRLVGPELGAEVDDAQLEAAMKTVLAEL